MSATPEADQANDTVDEVAARRVQRAAESVVKWEANLAALPEADEPEEQKECAA